MLGPAMSTDPIDFFRNTLPTLFAKGVELLEAKAASGNDKAKARLADVRAAKGAGYVVVQDRGSLYYDVVDGTMTPTDKPGAGLDVRFAVSLPADALEAALGEVARAGALDSDEAAIQATSTVSKRVEDVLAGRKITCHVTLKDVPDLGDVVIKFGLNVTEPPEKPAFTATIKYDDLEELREGKLTGQQLFMGGKIRMAGDYSVALQVGMQLMQPG
jgi:putative sterol carrier protein